MNSVDNPEIITVLSLCTGYGGLELGLSRALSNPLRVVAVEVEAYALANLAAKAQENKLAIEAMWPDLKTFPAKEFSGCFDFVIAGYPCQPFSCAGKRQGESDPRHLWPHIARIVQAVRPVWCFFENVSGHLTLGFPEVYRSLRTMGYKVEAGLFSAAECGAPHGRKRLFVLAYSERDDITPGGTQKQSILRERPVLSGQPPEGGEVGSYVRSGVFLYWPPRPNQVADIPRMADGSANRLDRCQLSGNGVVPQCAEKAFRELMRTFE